MKAVLTLFIATLLLGNTGVLAQKKNKLTDSLEVTILLEKHFRKNASVDSVFVFFDRFDHSGAGIIKQVYYPAGGRISVPGVPEGRYYIGVYCMGAHRQYFSEITFINKRRSNELRFKLDRSEEFTPGLFVPFMQIDFSKLAISNPKTFRR